MKEFLRLLLLVDCALLQVNPVQAQSNYEPYSFTTLAGLAASSGSADGTGSNARFYYPDGVAVDSAGNVYVSDGTDNTIRVGMNPVPRIISLSTNAAPVGAPLTITGSNFSATPANNIVYFGAVRATVTSATPRLPSASAGIGSTLRP